MCPFSAVGLVTQFFIRHNCIALGAKLNRLSPSYRIYDRNKFCGSGKFLSDL